jgi:RNA polymerase sigma-70 factor (ECF subfamily)
MLPRGTVTSQAGAPGERDAASRRQADPEEDDDLAAVWTAARASAADPAVADDVSIAVLVRARRWRQRGMSIARQQLVADAVRVTIALAPCEPLSGLPQAEREAIALARFAGLTTEDIATAVGVETAIVKTRLRDGLEAIAGKCAQTMHRHMSVI